PQGGSAAVRARAVARGGADRRGEYPLLRGGEAARREYGRERVPDGAAGCRIRPRGLSRADPGRGRRGAGGGGGLGVPGGAVSDREPDAPAGGGAGGIGERTLRRGTRRHTRNGNRRIVAGTRRNGPRGEHD